MLLLRGNPGGLHKPGARKHGILHWPTFGDQPLWWARRPLAGPAFAALFPTLILAIVFDLWAGIALWQSEARERPRTLGQREAATD